MDHTTRSVRAALAVSLPMLLTSSAATGQQLGTPQAYPQTQAYSQQPASQPQQLPAAQPQLGAPQQPPTGPQMPPGFPLNPLEQQKLDAVLDAWQGQSSKVTTFTCPFDRLEYVMAFGPVVNGQPLPLNKNLGNLTFSKPDKGNFEITEIRTWTLQPAPANQPQAPQQGDWVKQPNAIGEHWACDGKSVYEFRSDQKQVIERPLPPRAPGESIIDGPLPFLFGAESAKLKARYWMRIDDSQGNNPKPDPNQIWLLAWPKFQQQSADFRRVDVMLDRTRLLPMAMQVTLPNGDKHVYVFHLEQASVNGVLNRIQQALFTRPQTPFGWKHVVENAPVAQAPPSPQQQQPR